MASEIDNVTDAQGDDIMDAETKKPLVIFKTDIDRYGRDITEMSDSLMVMFNRCLWH